MKKFSKSILALFLVTSLLLSTAVISLASDDSDPRGMKQPTSKYSVIKQ